MDDYNKRILAAAEKYKAVRAKLNEVMETEVKPCAGKPGIFFDMDDVSALVIETGTAHSELIDVIMSGPEAGAAPKRDCAGLEAITCRHCRVVFGYTDGLNFYSSPDKTFRFRRSVTAECMTCRKPVCWTTRLKTKEELFAALQPA